MRSTLRNDRSSASPVNPLDYATYANPYERLYDENGNYAYDRSSYSTKSSIKDGYMYDFNILEDLSKFEVGIQNHRRFDAFFHGNVCEFK